MEMQMETQGRESIVKRAAPAKCAHEGCSCNVASGDRYCNDRCARQERTDSPAELDCICGHAECIHATGLPGRTG